MRTHISNNEVDAITVPAERSVQRTGPNLAVGRQRVGLPADDEVEWLEVPVLRLRELEEAGLGVDGRACGLLVCLERV